LESMLTVRTRVKKSKIHGQGLFTRQNIGEGELIWRFDPAWDEVFPFEDVLELPKHVRHFGYWSPRNIKLYIFPLGAARFMNFSDTPNTREVYTMDSPEDILVASRYIHRGEELTVPISSDLDAAWKLNLCHTPQEQQI
jgi:uncharacterized protein